MPWLMKRKVFFSVIIPLLYELALTLPIPFSFWTQDKGIAPTWNVQLMEEGNEMTEPCEIS